MKKVLLATSALVAFSGAAMAAGDAPAAMNIAITGSAEMGLVGGGLNATNGSLGETQYWNDVDVKFTMTGETDGGLAFGAQVDLDEAGNLGREKDNQGTDVWISGAFGKLTLGDTDGAVDWAITDAGNIGNPGSIADEETSHAGYNGSFGDGEFDNQVLRYEYSFGDFGIALSHEQGVDEATGVGGLGVLEAGDGSGSTAIGFKYGADLGGTALNFGIGYMNTDYTVGERDLWAIGLAATFAGGFQAGVTHQDWDYDLAAATSDVTHSAIGLGYESGPIAVHVNYGVFDFSDPLIADVEGWGFAAAYDLGGGASVHFGYGDSDVVDAESWSLGMSFSF